MALPADYISGTITLTAGSTAFTGTGTGWLAADFREGDIILDVLGGGNRVAVVAAVTGNGAGTLTKPWEGPTLANVAYRLRYQWDSGRVSAQTRTLIEQLGNGNLQSLAAITGAADNVVVFNGPGAIGIEPRTNFINGVAYDVQVNTLADRAAYNGQSAGFTVLVSNVGDGRSAIYSKASNASGDWTNAAYVTGPVGPNPTITASATTLAPGSAATVTTTPITGGVNLGLGIPAGEGFVSRGAYSGATAYVKGDVVQNNGSSWIAKISTTGNTPPVLPTTSNTWWELLASAGLNGTGTGDFVGPASAIDGETVLFSGTTGKLGKRGPLIQTSVTDATIGRLMGVGAFGLGGVSQSITDWNSVDINGALYGAFSATNAPTTGDLLGVYNRYSELYGVLTVRTTTGSSPREFRRIKNNGVWQPWTETYSKSNILGTVSQTAGAPTGAIIERGSNANGSYIRFADGTQICHFKSTTALVTTVVVGSVFASVLGTFTFPVAFIAPPGVALNAVFSAVTAPWVSGAAVTTTTAGIYLLSALSGGSGFPEYIAVGRWF